MTYGPFSPLYLLCSIAGNIAETELALRLALDGTEAVWLTPQGQPLFKIDLAGVVDDEKRVSRYLKMKKAQPGQDAMR